jgi:hypothetical protein
MGERARRAGEGNLVAYPVIHYSVHMYAPPIHIAVQGGRQFTSQTIIRQGLSSSSAPNPQNLDFIAVRDFVRCRAYRSVNSGNALEAASSETC